MSRLESAAGELIATLHDLGIRAVTDPRDLDLPGAYLAPHTLTCETLDGTKLAITWDVYLIGPDNGAHLHILGPLLDAATPLIAGRTITTQGITLSNLSPDPLPALHFQIETETTKCQ